MPPDQNQPSTPIPSPAAAKPRTILSIEDEQFISELYARALTKAGYEVTIEHDGKAGLERLRQTVMT